jgi:hypothetical protein
MSPENGQSGCGQENAHDRYRDHQESNGETDAWEIHRAFLSKTLAPNHRLTVVRDRCLGPILRESLVIQLPRADVPHGLHSEGSAPALNAFPATPGLERPHEKSGENHRDHHPPHREPHAREPHGRALTGQIWNRSTWIILCLSCHHPASRRPAQLRFLFFQDGTPTRQPLLVDEICDPGVWEASSSKPNGAAVESRPGATGSSLESRQRA